MESIRQQSTQRGTKWAIPDQTANHLDGGKRAHSHERQLEHADQHFVTSIKLEFGFQSNIFQQVRRQE